MLTEQTRYGSLAFLLSLEIEQRAGLPVIAGR
jgi:hypothetical protein